MTANSTPDPRVTYRPVSPTKALVLVNGKHVWDLRRLGDKFVLCAGPGAGMVMMGRSLVETDDRERMKIAIGSRALAVVAYGHRW